MITCNTDPARFDELGYCVFRQGLSADEVRSYSDLFATSLAANEMKGEPHYYSQAWLDLCCHPSVLDAIETILGPELILF